MPWKVYTDGSQFCVHKLNEDGSKGEKVACHATKDKAEAQMRALYRSVSMNEMIRQRAKRA